jgi:hypothetical protein
MSLTLKVNFLKGWPNPSIAEKVSQPDTGVTTLDQGMTGHQNPANGKWVLGISAVTQLPYVFRNAQGDPDSGRLSTDPASYIQGALGGIQGVAYSNPIEFETAQYGTTCPTGSTNCGTPAAGDQLFADVDGLLYVAITAGGVTKKASQAIVAQVTQGVHAYQGTNMISVVPDNSKRSS